MAGSGTYKTASRSTDDLARVRRQNERTDSRPGLAGGLLRPSRVPVPGAAALARPVPGLLPGAGQPLATPLKEEMESRLGADFSDVRVHADAGARASAAALGADAYTVGSHIVIGDSGTDRHTLAHELTHVIQQREGPVDGADNGAGLRISSPDDRFEREAETSARRVLSGPSPGQAAAAPVVQRKNGKKEGEFIGSAAGVHIHIGIGNPHLKLGANGPRYDIRGTDYQGYSFQRCADALDALTMDDRHADANATACRQWLEDILDGETIPDIGRPGSIEGSRWGQGLLKIFPARPFRKGQ